MSAAMSAKVGRPKTKLGERHRGYFDVPADLYRRLEAEATRRDVSVNFLIGRFIDRSLATFEGQELP